MTTSILIAVILGAGAGAAPGPYTTMVVGTALQRGFPAAFKLALVPLVADVIPLIVTVFILDALSHTALTMLGIAGGTIVAMVGVRFLRDQTPAIDGEPEYQAARFGHAAASTFFSPAPWFFWLILAGPLTLRALEGGALEGVIFVVLIFVTNIGTASLLAWAVSHSRTLIAPAVQRRVLQVTGIVLISAGAVLVWQAVEGNFQAMMERQQNVREMFESRID